MDNQTIDFRDILALLLRNSLIIILVFILSLGTAVALIHYLPRQYKSKAVVTIESGYFQHPLLSNIVAGTIDQNEIKGQRQALLQQAISLNFLEQLGEEFNKFTPGATPAKHLLERELLAKDIEIYGISATAFQISVKSDTRQSALAMTKAVVSQVENTIYEERNETLQVTREALERKVDQLSKALAEGDGSSGVQSSRKLKMELDKLENDIKVMLQRYTEAHPEVQKLRAKERILKRAYESVPKEDPNSETAAPKIFLSDSAQKPVREKYDDLLKNLINVEILLDGEKSMDRTPYFSIIEQPSLPASPSFPNPKLFLLFGIVGGLLGSALIVILREFRRGTFVSPYYISDQLDMPLLGELPYDKNVSHNLLLLDRSEYRKTQKLLPAHFLSKDKDGK